MAVIEVTTFRVSGNEEQFLAADTRMQTDFVYQQRGCARRTTARGDNGEWLVVTMWTDATAADDAARAAQTDPVAQEFASLTADTQTRRYTTLE